MSRGFIKKKLKHTAQFGHYFNMEMKKLRKNRRLTQQNVADFLQIPLRTYANYETGSRKPTPEMLCKLADFFDVTVDELLGRTSSPELFDDARTSINPIIEMYNQLTPHQQELIIERMQGFIDGNLERQNIERERSAQNSAIRYFVSKNSD